MSHSNQRRAARVLYLVNVLGSGGSERNVAAICKHCDRDRLDPVVWTLLDGGDYEPSVREADVPIRCLRRGRSYSPVFALSAARQIARCDADIIHAFNPAIAFYAALARRLCGIRIPMVYYEGNSRSLGPRWRSKVSRWTARQFTHYMANSRASGQFLESKISPRSPVRIIPNGHETECWRAHGDRDEIRRKLGITPEQKLAIFVGRLVEQKRVCDLLDAVARIFPSREALRVIVVGTGSEEVKLKEQVERIGLSEVVRFLGRRRDVPQLLMASDLFVYPSEFDGLANVVIEAALAGLPIVACDAPGVRDAVVHGEHALLVPPRNVERLGAAIADVLDDPKRSQQRADSALQHAMRSYTMESMLHNLSTFYDDILAEA
ncbi:MAG: glycosyltransferase [Planctomycetes bacterium]|nr:glycosyltransferase [Planctomycetota bacterium]